MSETLDFIFKRRSIRKFSDQPVSEVDLNQLLKAAMAAPNAMNARPWEFVVITDSEVIQRIGSSLLFGKHHPAAVIAVCGRKRAFKIPASSLFWVQDCSAATENILLAATALNLGSVWVGVYPIDTYVKRISKILDLPKEVTPLGLVYLGHPAEQKAARSQYDASRVHWQTYAPQKRQPARKPSQMQTTSSGASTGTQNNSDVESAQEDNGGIDGYPNPIHANG